ncbi:MFS transporter [Henriciella sp. AS95]|uniref:MFS transporter n=1 Tax=Henriciella sp. AS95 TaxID=3135782 RepID=UPI00317DB1D1
MVGVSVGLSPIPFYTIGMFAPELSDAFGWSFSAMMGSIAVQSIVVMLVSPFAGYAVDRFGARRVATVSLFCFGLCFMSLSLNGGSLTVFYAQWVVMSVLGAGTLSATWTYVVNGWFDRHKGLALGLASAGTGITGFLIKPFTAWLITEFGWRIAFAAIGMLPILIGIPVVLLFLRERSASGEPVVPAIEEDDDQPAPAASAGYSLKEAMHQKNFWILVVAFLLIAFSLTAPTPNLENILRTKEFSLGQIGTITASFGLAVIAGRLIGGWLLDKAWAPLIAFFILMIPAFGCWMLSMDDLGSTAAFLAVAGIGFGAGFEFDLLAYLVSRYFGQRQYGLIYGCFYTVIALGGGLGPVVYGHIYDTVGGYTFPLTAGALIVMVGGALLMLLGRYPDFDRSQESAQFAGTLGKTAA